uniref:Putative secreted protein n=1 Tax=Ixodes scapularis TaxID=6945 RepID=A0A4D5S236_IXOSC
MGVPTVLIIYPRARRIFAARLPGLLCAGHGGAPSFWVCCRASVNGMGPRFNPRTCFEGGKHCQCFVRFRCVNLYSISLEERIERFLSGLQ